MQISMSSHYRRLLELTGTIKKKDSGKNEQVLDKLKVERERGITGTTTTFMKPSISSSQTFTLQ